MRKLAIFLAAATLMTMPTMAEYVTAESGLRLREKPSLDAVIIDVLPFRTKVTGISADGWLETKDGYLSTEFLSDEDPISDWTSMGTWMTTAYTHTGNPTASGAYPTAGYTVACNSLPMGTELYISGVGFRTVEDRGPSSMPDAWLDIFMDGYSECVSWGVRNREVWMKGE